MSGLHRVLGLGCGLLLLGLAVVYFTTGMRSPFQDLRLDGEGEALSWAQAREVETTRLALPLGLGWERVTFEFAVDPGSTPRRGYSFQPSGGGAATGKPQVEWLPADAEVYRVRGGTWSPLMLPSYRIALGIAGGLFVLLLITWRRALAQRHEQE